MFHLETISGARLTDNKIIVDHERGVSLRFVSVLGPYGGKALKLVWGDRVIPFEIVREQHEDEKTHEFFYVTQFRNFGASMEAESKEGIPTYAFANIEERRQAQILTVEALLVFSDHYSGEERPEGYDRVKFEGRLYTKKDFGIQ